MLVPVNVETINPRQLHPEDATKPPDFLSSCLKPFQPFTIASHLVQTQFSSNSRHLNYNSLKTLSILEPIVEFS